MDFKKNQTIYLQIADFICEEILAGKLPPGEKIQSVREMAASVQVNPNTIMRTYTHLTDQEIIYNKRGIGYFVAEDASKKTKLIRRNELINTYLPDLFHNMKLLDMDFAELKKIYERSQNGNGKENGNHYG